MNTVEGLMKGNQANTEIDIMPQSNKYRINLAIYQFRYITHEDTAERYY